MFDELYTREYIAYRRTLVENAIYIIISQNVSLAESFCSIVDIGSSAISSYNDCQVRLFQPQLSTFLFSPTFNHQMKLYSIKKIVRMFLQD